MAKPPSSFNPEAVARRMIDYAADANFHEHETSDVEISRRMIRELAGVKRLSANMTQQINQSLMRSGHGRVTISGMGIVSPTSGRGIISACESELRFREAEKEREEERALEEYYENNAG